jgi:hypothetical protein
LTSMLMIDWRGAELKEGKGDGTRRKNTKV